MTSAAAGGHSGGRQKERQSKEQREKIGAEAEGCAEYAERHSREVQVVGVGPHDKSK